MKKKLERMADVVGRDTLADLQRTHGTTYDWTRDATVTVHIGKKYARVDVGRSGKYMVDLATGEIFGIKAYGVIHKGHRYGTLDTLDDWFWGRYSAEKKGTVTHIRLTGKAVA
jgi:hypothetical protein